MSNRKQRVVINGKFSHWIRVTSGIPQGSVLGPILFLIFINDLPDVLNCCMKIFAEDAKLYNFFMSITTRLAIDRSICILTRPVVNTGFNRSLLVDWWSIGQLKKSWSM